MRSVTLRCLVKPQIHRDNYIDEIKETRSVGHFVAIVVIIIPLGWSKSWKASIEFFLLLINTLFSDASRRRCKLLFLESTRVIQYGITKNVNKRALVYRCGLFEYTLAYSTHAHPNKIKGNQILVGKRVYYHHIISVSYLRVLPDICFSHIHQRHREDKNNCFCFTVSFASSVCVLSEDWCILPTLTGNPFSYI